MSGTDDDLLTRLLSGEASAVLELQGMIKRAASPFRRRLGDAIEDIQSEALLSILDSVEEGDVPRGDSCAGWVWRVVSHDCIDEIRRKKVRGETNLDDVEEIQVPPTQHLKIVQQEGRGDEARVVRMAPESCKELWQMRVRGISYADIAVKLGVSEGALRVRALRCRRWARSQLDRES